MREGVDPSAVQANFLVEDWSTGSADIQKRAQIEPSTVKIFVNSASSQVCAEGDAVSLYPGMARIELDIVGDTGRLGYDPASPLFKHQFLAGWMTLNTPSLKEMASTDFVSTAQAEAAKELGDPTGNGAFSAGGNNGYLDVKVTGSMPTDAWTGLGLPASVTLPNDWPTLAKALATDSDPTDSTPWTKWDTSGDSTGLEGHVVQSPPCAAEPASEAGVPTVPLGNDNGDNCTGGGADGGFSTVFGTLSPAGSTIGPFDPVNSAATLLSDGSLNSQDAPMPAARIDVAIAPNSGAAGDISGVGSLEPADKTKTASRDFLGDSSAHNLYSPFYDAYIPATTRGDVSSGIDGAFANNFNGFLVNGKYHFWDIAAELASNTNTATSCLHRSYDPQTDKPTAHPGDYYQTPSGASNVAVYTEQNGEAQVQYNPGTGFYFDSLIHNGGAILNANGGCDLQNVGTLGTSSITATARYPFKPVPFLAMTSAPVTKSVASLWSKTLAYFPKGPGAANSVSRIVVAHAQDIDGHPFAHEVVCFSADKNAEAVYRFNGTVAGINLNGVGPASDPKGGNRTCVTTDANGNAAVEVLNSDLTAVNVIADFTREGILRNISVDFATPGSSGGTPPPPTGTPATAPTTASGSNSGTTAPSVSLIKAVAPSLLGSTKAKTIKTHITLARFVSPAHGQHYALINVRSSSHNAKVRLRLLVRTHGNHTRVVVRVVTVRTNQRVKIAMGGNVVKILGVKLV